MNDEYYKVKVKPDNNCVEDTSIYYIAKPLFPNEIERGFLLFDSFDDFGCEEHGCLVKFEDIISYELMKTHK